MLKLNLQTGRYSLIPSQNTRKKKDMDLYKEDCLILIREPNAPIIDWFREKDNKCSKKDWIQNRNENLMEKHFSKTKTP